MRENPSLKWAQVRGPEVIIPIGLPYGRREPIQPGAKFTLWTLQCALEKFTHKNGYPCDNLLKTSSHVLQISRVRNWGSKYHESKNNSNEREAQYDEGTKEYCKFESFY